MAVKRNALSGALVPVAGPDGGVVWQSWTYGELLQHLNNDLQVDPNTLDPSVLGGLFTNPGPIQTTPWRAYRTAALTLTALTWTLIPYDTMLFGDATRLASGGFRAPVAGIYHVSAHMVASAAAASAFTATFLTLNGDTPGVGASVNQQFYGSQANWPGGGTPGQPTSVLTGDVKCAAADVINIWGFSVPTVNLAGGLPWSGSSISVNRVA